MDDSTRDQALAWAKANSSHPVAQQVLAKDWADHHPTHPKAAEVYAKIDQHNEQAAAPANSEDTPAEGELYSDANRAKTGFADDEHATDLVSPSFSHAHKNKAGEMVAQDKSGKWVKDADNLLPSWGTFKRMAMNPNVGAMEDMINTMHPQNFLEASAGKSLPTGGMVAGGFMGGGWGSIPAAGLLGAAGESLRRGVGQLLGVHGHAAEDTQNPDSTAPFGESDFAKDLPGIAGEGAKSAAYEAGGKMVGAVPISKIPVVRRLGDTLGDVPGTLFDMAKKPVAKASSLMTGVPYQDTLQLMRRPVENFTAPALDEAASTAQMELMGRRSALGAPVEAANDAHLAARGGEHIDTSPATQSARDRLASQNVSQGGSGRMSQAEIDDMTAHLDREFNNPQVVAPEVRASKISYEKPYDEPFSPPDRVVPGEEYVHQPEKTVDADFPTMSSLKATIDGIDAQVERWYEANPFAKTTPAHIQELKLLRNNLKQVYTSRGATGAAVSAADAPYSEFMDDAHLLKGLNSEATQEGVSKGLFGPTKSNARKAAERQIPNAMEGLKDWHSADAFHKAGMLGEPGVQQNTRLGILGLFGLNALNHHSAETMAATGLAAGLMSPMVHRAVLGAGSLAGNAAADQFWPLLARKTADKYHLLKETP